MSEQVTISIETPGSPAQTFSIERQPEITIGREDACTVVLPSPDISRKHLTLEVTPTHVTVRDSSSNGTRVGEIRVHRNATRVGFGTPMYVGPYIVRVDGVTRTETPAATPAPKPDAPAAPAPASAGLERTRAGMFRPTEPPASTSEETHEVTVSDGLAPLRTLLADPTVMAVLIDAPDRVFVERAGRIEPTHAAFDDAAALTAALQELARSAGVRLDAEHPIVEARLTDGMRFEAVVPPAAPDGPCASLRRVVHEPVTLQKLIETGSLTPAVAALLETLVALGQNVVVAGGPGSGRTGLLGALTGFVPDGERIVVVEDGRTVHLPRAHAVRLQSHAGDAHGRGAVTASEVVRAALRLRPDRLVVAEVRGTEAREVVDALAAGRARGLVAVSATHPTDALSRLEALAGEDSRATRAQLPAALGFVVQTARMADGVRRVTHVAEVRRLEATRGYELANLYERRFHGRDSDGTVLSTFEPTGELPACLELVHSRGTRLPEEMYEASRARSLDG